MIIVLTGKGLTPVLLREGRGQSHLCLQMREIIRNSKDCIDADKMQKSAKWDAITTTCKHLAQVRPFEIFEITTLSAFVAVRLSPNSHCG